MYHAVEHWFWWHFVFINYVNRQKPNRVIWHTLCFSFSLSVHWVQKKHDKFSTSTSPIADIYVINDSKYSHQLLQCTKNMYYLWVVFFLSLKTQTDNKPTTTNKMTDYHRQTTTANTDDRSRVLTYSLGRQETGLANDQRIMVPLTMMTQCRTCWWLNKNKKTCDEQRGKENRETKLNELQSKKLWKSLGTHGRGGNIVKSDFVN